MVTGSVYANTDTELSVTDRYILKLQNQQWAQASQTSWSSSIIPESTTAWNPDQVQTTKELLLERLNEERNKSRTKILEKQKLATNAAIEKMLEEKKNQDAEVEQTNQQVAGVVLEEKESQKKKTAVQLYIERMQKEGKLERISPDVNEQLFNDVKTASSVTDYSDRYTYKRIQQKSLSCESSAAADILAYHTWEKVTEDYVISKLGKSMYNQAQYYEWWKRIWWNPNVGFVGYIDKTPSGAKADQWLQTGYGVLEKPIARVYANEWLRTRIITEDDYSEQYNEDKHLTDLVSALDDGHSVQLWGDYCTTPAYDNGERNNCISLNYDRSISWYYKTASGELEQHTGLSGEHAFYLLGYKWTRENPSHVIIWDTQTGKHTYVMKEWKRKWNMMQNRSIIIYKD